MSRISAGICPAEMAAHSAKRLESVRLFSTDEVCLKSVQPLCLIEYALESAQPLC